MNKTRYLIIGYSRSGTTVTHLAIMGHPNVAALNDEMQVSPFFTKGISTFTHGNDLEEEKERAYSHLFDAITLLKANHETTAHGVKVACNSHERAMALVNVLQNHLKDLKIIIIVRKDLVAQYGSGIHGAKTGIMHSWYREAKDMKVRKIKIKKYLFITYVNNVIKMYNVIRGLENSHDVLEIYYEDLIRDPQNFYRKIFEFLNLPVINPTWLTSKKVLPAPEDYIINYAAMKSLLLDLKNDSVPAHTVFISKCISHLIWRIRTLWFRTRSIIQS